VDINGGHANHEQEQPHPFSPLRGMTGPGPKFPGISGSGNRGLSGFQPCGHCGSNPHSALLGMTGPGLQGPGNVGGQGPPGFQPGGFHETHPQGVREVVGIVTIGPPGFQPEGFVEHSSGFLVDVEKLGIIGPPGFHPDG